MCKPISIVLLSVDSTVQYDAIRHPPLIPPFCAPPPKKKGRTKHEAHQFSAVAKANFHNKRVTVFPKDPSTFSEGDWRHCYVGLEGPIVPSKKVLGSLGPYDGDEEN